MLLPGQKIFKIEKDQKALDKKRSFQNSQLSKFIQDDLDQFKKKRKLDTPTKEETPLASRSEATEFG